MINLEEMSVLIVDDMENMCKSIRGMLKVLHYGKKYRLANNGVDALKIIKEVPIDLMISDWNMPIMNGAELLERIRESPDHRDMPVVMVTAEANRDIVAEAAESDIDAYILKPLTVKSLGDRIAAVVERANNPPPAVLHLKKARSLKEKGEIDAAIEETKLALKADRDSSKPYREIGHLFYMKNELQMAEKWLLRAAQMNKFDVFAFHCLGEIYLKRNDIDQAADWFEKAMSVSPRHVPRGVYFGKILIQKGLFDRGEIVLDKAITLSGNDPVLMEEIVAYCIEQKAYRYALKLLEIMLKVAPEQTDVLSRMGKIYEILEEPQNALKYFMRADKIEDKNIEHKLSIARNYIKMDQMLRADLVLKDVLRIDPENEEAKSLTQQCL